MSTLEQLQKAIETASSVSANSSLDDLEHAEDEAFMIYEHAGDLKYELLDEIYAAMEIRRRG